MPIVVSWFSQEQSIFELILTDPWTFGEVVAALDEIEQLMATHPTTVVLVSDATASKQTPQLDIAELRKVVQHNVLRSKDLVHCYVVGAKISLKVFIGVASSLFPAFFKIVSTYNSREEALEAASRHPHILRTLPVSMRKG